MKTLAFLLFATFATLALTPSAFAGVFECSQKTSGDKDFKVSVNFTDAKPDAPSVYKSTVTLGDDSFPQLGAACFVMDRPSTRYIKCAHQSGNTRIEIYPTVEKSNGSLKLMQFIIWDGATPQRGDFSNCSTK